MFNALVLPAPNEPPAVRQMRLEELPDNPVRIAVHYSSVNYKDALAIGAAGRIIRGSFPFVPGIDLVGQVIESDSDGFAPGDWVTQTGGGLGESTWGGLSQRQHVTDQWLVSIPSNMTPLKSMIAGTAGLTAMYAVMALNKHGVEPGSGDVIVTGASGGVGSFAVALLAALGYTVAASTGKTVAHEYLRKLGASRIVDRTVLSGGPARPLQRSKWAGAVDTVGGQTLAAVVSSIRRHGSVAACGNAGGARLETSVFPFILRGVSLLGIDSNTAPVAQRREAWELLAATLADEVWDQILSGIIPLAEVFSACTRMLRGEVTGRIVVDVNG